jgi:hypothetical protein
LCHRAIVNTQYLPIFPHVRCRRSNFPIAAISDGGSRAQPNVASRRAERACPPSIKFKDAYGCEPMRRRGRTPFRRQALIAHNPILGSQGNHRQLLHGPICRYRPVHAVGNTSDDISVARCHQNQMLFANPQMGMPRTEARFEPDIKVSPNNGLMPGLYKELSFG